MHTSGVETEKYRDPILVFCQSKTVVHFVYYQTERKRERKKERERERQREKGRERVF
jgi:hypothetical protein